MPSRCFVIAGIIHSFRHTTTDIMLHDRLREIRTQLRLAMNGIASASMREKGVVYKLNFGVSLPEIKQIAAAHQPDSELAAALWKEDVREFKILASMLQPTEDFSMEQAKQWVEEIPYLEIAEQCCRNLFARLPYAGGFIQELIAKGEGEYALTAAYLTGVELFKSGKKLDASRGSALLKECLLTLVRPDAAWKEWQAAVKVMKFYGRQSKKHASEVLGSFGKYPEFMKTPEGQEVYNDLKFEFEYYS